MKIAKKINLSFSSLLIIILGISFLNFYAISKHTLRENIHEHLKTAAESRAKHVNTFLDEFRSEMSIISKSELTKRVLKYKDSAEIIEQANSEFQHIVQEEDHFYELFVIDQKGRVISSSDESQIGKDKSNAPYFLNASEQGYIKDAYFSNTTKEYSLAASAYVHDKETSEILGVIVARIHLDDLNTITTERTGLGNTGEIYIVNKNNFMITKSRFIEHDFLSIQVESEDLQDDQMHLHTKAGIVDEEVTAYPDYRDAYVFGTHYYIPDMQWNLFAEISVEEAMAPVSRIKYFAIIGFLSAVFLVYLISYLISKNITSPIDELIMGTEKIGSGDLDHKIGIDTKDEIGQLASSFDNMTSNLKKITASRHELNAMNQQLMAQQQQLRASNQQLDAMNQQLQASQEQLKVSNDQLMSNEQQLRALNINLAERVKELNCFYQIAKTIEKKDYSLDDILQDTVKILKSCWKYPEICCVRIKLNNREFLTSNFNESTWKQSADLIVKGKSVGCIQVYYLEEKPELEDGPFSNQERELINAVAERLGRVIERKYAEKALQESEDRFMDIFYSSNDAILLIDDNMFVDCNQAVVEMLGYDSKEKLLKTHPSKLSCPKQPDGRDSFEKANEMIQLAFENGNHEFEWIHRKANGEDFPVKVSLTPIIYEGKRVLYCVWRDISKEKEYEKERAVYLLELLDAQRMAQEANKAKSRFLANMSHEIRTPMNSILGFAELIADESLSETQREYLRIVRQSGKSLLSLINDILDLSKIEAGKFDINKDKCSLGQLLNSLESMMSINAEQKGIEFKVIDDGNLPEHIFTDCDRLKQCLINLANNAIKFTEDGHVHVKVSLQSVNNQQNIRFDVEDTGIGISENNQEKVFDDFSQADQDTSRKFGGTGLGLSITKHLVELLGGEISLCSELGKGSVFSIVMPVGLDVTQESSMDRSKDVSEETYSLENTSFSGKVLVAEDVQANQLLIRSLLEKMDIDVTIVCDGEQAVQKASGESFDLILMDIQMPNMDGYEATRTLRDKSVNTPIVALTASALKEDRHKCDEAGCDGYLTKPIDRQLLIAKLTEYLSSVKTKTKAQNSAAQGHSGSPDNIDTRNDDIIDSKVLAELDLDNNMIEEVLSVCIEENGKILDQLCKAVQDADAERIATYAHSIKGSVANVGGTRLSEIAMNLEQMAIKEDLTNTKALLDDMINAFDEFKAFIADNYKVQASNNQ